MSIGKLTTNSDSSIQSQVISYDNNQSDFLDPTLLLDSLLIKDFGTQNGIPINPAMEILKNCFAGDTVVDDLLANLCKLYPDAMSKLANYVNDNSLHGDLTRIGDNLNNSQPELQIKNFAPTDIQQKISHLLEQQTISEPTANKSHAKTKDDTNYQAGVIPIIVYVYIYSLIFEYSAKKDFTGKKNDEVKQFAAYVDDGLLTVMDNLDAESKAVLFAIVFSSVVNDVSPVHDAISTLKQHISKTHNNSSIDLMANFNDWLTTAKRDSNYADGLGALYQIIADKSGLFVDGQASYSAGMLNNLLQAIVINGE